MPYFLSIKNLSLQQPVEFSEGELRHLLLSHRIKVGEQVFVQGPDGKRFACVVDKVGKREVVVMPTSQVSVPEEPKINIVLFQAVVAEKALDFILQKSTELGAAKIVLWNSENTATKLSESQFKNKQDRWNKILWEAAKQSERAVVPELGYCLDLEASLKLGKTAEHVIVLDAHGQKTFLNMEEGKSIAIFVGPEGGFKPSEVEKMTQSGVIKVSLGPRVLRAETAALAALAIIGSK